MYVISILIYIFQSSEYFYENTTDRFIFWISYSLANIPTQRATWCYCFALWRECLRVCSPKWFSLFLKQTLLKYNISSFVCWCSRDVGKSNQNEPKSGRREAEWGEGGESRGRVSGGSCLPFRNNDMRTHGFCASTFHIKYHKIHNKWGNQYSSTTKT